MKYFFTILFIGIIVSAYIISKLDNTDIEPLPIKLEQPEFFLEDTPSIELVSQACEYYNIKHSGIVVSQAILETGHFKSENCIKGNNLFGLYNSKKKEFFKFNHWTESVKAYRDMIQYRYTEGDYYQWLEKIGYAEDSLYTQKLVNIKKTIFTMKC